MQKLKYKNIILVLLCGVLTACFGTPEKNLSPGEAEKRALFTVQELDSSSSLSINQESGSSLPESFTLSLKACLVAQTDPGTALHDTEYLLSLEEGLLNSEFKKYREGVSTCQEDKKKSKSLFSHIFDLFTFRFLWSAKTDKDPETTNEDKPRPCLSGKLSARAGKENKVIKVTADTNGCITWGEEYGYVYVTESQWVKTTRHIISLSPQFPGGFPIELVINPWLQKIDEQDYNDYKVRDFRIKHRKNVNLIQGSMKYNIPGLDFLKTAKEFERSEKANIMVDNIILHISDVRSIPHRTDPSTHQPVLRKILKGKIEAPLQYSIKSINGKYQHNDITTGDFSVELNLLTRINTDKEDPEEDPENMRRINIIPQKNNTQNVTNKPKVNFEADTDSKTPKLKSETFQWIYEYKTTNQPVYLHFKLFPRGETAKRVKPFEGIYSISLKSFHNITDSLSQKIYLEDSLRGKYITLLNNYHNGLSQALKTQEDKHNKTDKKTSSSKQSSSKTSALSESHTKKGPQAFIDCVRTKTNGNRECSLQGLSPHDSGATGVSWPISRLFFRHNNVVKEHWLSRKVKTVVEGSLKDSNNMALPGQKINIEVTDFTTGEVNRIENVDTKEEGIFSFNIFTKQHWYKRQRYFLKKLRFFYGQQMNVTRLIMINPWDYGFTHGFEIEGPTNNRVTCLNETKNEKTSLQTLLTDLKKSSSLLQFDNKTEEALKAKNLIQNLFCYDPSLRDFYNMPKDKGSSFLKLPDLFVQFKHLLKQVFEQEGMAKGLGPTDREKRQTEFLYTKFETSKKAHPASLYIHLLRSITTFPDYTIDNSLNRDLRFNMSFKLTPRVVRHDDLARGQQNKGPLRDGVYIFQLAVLKNKQERWNGDYTMVKKMSDEALQVPLGHTTSLCEKGGGLHDCLSNVDFILPPVNVPVLVRDGMVRTEFKLPLTQEQFLFSDSKSVMVFRIVPADPTSVVCKDGTSQCAITGSEADSGYAGSAYLANMDWEKSAASLKAIDLENNPYSDMAISTWRAPFILSRWANWTITSEMRESFDQLSHKYFLEEQKHLLHHFYTQTIQKLNSQLAEVQIPDPALEVAKHSDSQPPPQLANKQAKKVQSLLQKLEAKKQEKLGQIDNLFVDKFGALDTNHKEGTQKFSEEMESLSASAEEGTSQMMKLKNIRMVEPDLLNQIKKHVKSSSVLNKACASVSTDGRLYRVPLASQRKGIGGVCRRAMADSKNRGDFHIARLASENALCILNVDSQNASLSRGNEEAQIRQCRKNQNDFITYINSQIALIHAKKNTTYPANFPGMAPTGFAGYMIPGYSVSDYSYRLDMGRKGLVPSGDKEVTELSHKDVEQIITRGVRPQTFRTDFKTQAFTQALCGFWFDQFYSSYMPPQLLIDGFREKAKTDIYYQMRGITAPAGHKGLVAQWEGGQASHEDSPLWAENLKEGIESVKEALNRFQKEQDQSGHLWNIHDWISGRRGAEGSLPARLENHLISQVGKTPFKSVSSFGWTPEGKIPPPVLENLPGSHPVLKCLKNPTHFFAFENKIIVGEVSDSSKIHKYKKGVPQTFRVSENFFMNTQRDQGANQGSETNMGFNTSVAVIPALTTLAYAALYKKAGVLAAAAVGGAAAGPLGIGVGAGLLLATLSAQPIVGHNYAYRGYEGTGARRLISFIVEQGVNLRAEESHIQLGLKDYRHCLVVRPRFSAFGFKTANRINPYRHIWKNDVAPYLRSLYAKSGMLLCTPGKKEDKTIEEHYYYISPDYTAQDGRSQDPASFRNKPFAINIRGKEAFHKFKEDISCYMADAPEHEQWDVSCRDTKRRFKYLLNQRFEFSDNLRKGFNFPKTFHSTGSVPGVHSLDKKPVGGVYLKEGEGVKPEDFLKKLGEWGPDADLTQYLKKSFISPDKN